MVNELSWKLGLRSARLVLQALKGEAKFKTLRGEDADAAQLKRLCVELQELVQKTPERWVKVEVLDGEGAAEGDAGTPSEPS